MSVKSYGIGLVVTLFSLLGCGGGGGGGNSGGTPTSITPPNTTPATVTTSNSEVVSRSSIDVAKRAPGLEASSGVGFKSAATNGDLEAMNARVTDYVVDQLNIRLNPSLAQRIVQDVPCASGSITVDFPNIDANAQTFPDSGSGLMTFNNCSEMGETINGTATFSWSGGFDQINGFRNFTVVVDATVTVAGQPAQQVTGTVTCTNFGASCSVQESFVGADGSSVTVEGVTVSGDSSTGYNLSAQVYHEEFGAITITASNIVFCSNGNIQSGSISVTDSTNAVVLVINFSNCDEFTATFDGVSNTYPQ
jgi:hypothetical protein